MGLAHSPRIVTNGLVLCLDAGNTKSYPGSGTTITDLSGLTNNGTLVGSPTISGSGITLNGTNQNIDTNYTQTSVTQYTIDVWFKTTSTSPQMTFVQNRGSGAGVSISMGMGPYDNGPRGAIWIAIDTNSIITQLMTISTFNDGNWHNAIGTFNQASGTITTGSFALYMDGLAAATTTSGAGSLQAGSTTSPVTGLGGTRLGRHEVWGTWFNGTLGPCKIYTRALTAAEIQQNFNALRGRFGI